jgi:hypothetical protein
MSAAMKRHLYIVVLGLASLFAIFIREAGALPMDHPNFGYCPGDLSRRANVNACPGVGARAGAARRRGIAGGAGGRQMPGEEPAGY